MRAPILDQPVIGVTDGHVEKVDWYHGDDRPIRTIDIAHGKERIDDGDIGLDEANPVVGERRLRGAVDGLRLGTEVFTIATCPCIKSPCGVTKVPFSVNREARCSAFF
jgi:hypothetical protein